MMIFYKSYQYAPIATLVSGLSSALAVCAVLGGLALFGIRGGSALKMVGGVVLIALAAFLFFYCSRTLPDKMSEKESEKNIRTKASYALMYCKENPEAYDQLIAENMDFARKYIRNNEGKIVKVSKFNQ